MAPPPPDAPARLVLDLPDGSSQEFTLSRASVLIGRATTSDIVLRDWTVSRSHARIERTPRGYEIVDLGSVNGTRVNGVPRDRAALLPGDELRLGDSAFRFEPASRGADVEATRIHARPAFETTLAGLPLQMHLQESSLPRVAIHTRARTWEVSMTGDALTIGREEGNDIRFDDPAVSRNHAVIERHGGGFVARDLESRNGTWSGSQRISRVAIREGDSLTIGQARLVFKPGLSSRDLAPDDPEAPAARRPVVVIPGFAGSNLWLGDDQVWPTMRMLDLADSLRIDRPLEARGIVDELVIVPSLIKLDHYGILTGYLRESLGYEPGRDLLEFGYDFRQDNRESARELAAAIEEWDVAVPITIVAHSMGCLIARYYIERLGGRKKVERVILLGGPHAGTPYAFASLLKGPDLLPLGMMNQRLRDVIATFPSWYEILPTYRCVSHKGSTFSLYEDDSWLPEDQRPLLGRARAFRSELGTRSSVPAVCIFGYGIETVTGAVVERDARGVLVKADFVASDQGDGTIPESSAVLKHAEIHPVRQHHGSLYVDNDVKMRLKLELLR